MSWSGSLKFCRAALLLCSHFLFFRSLFNLLFLLLLVFLLQLRADEFENGKLGTITDTPADADDARVTAGAIREARSEIGKELPGRIRGLEERGSLPPRVERIALAERDQTFGKRASRFGAKQGSLNALLLDEVGHQVAQCCPAMRRLAAQFVA